MKRLLMSLVVLFGTTNIVSAQDYSWAIGVLTGSEDAGITFKYHLNPINSFELRAGLPYSDGFSLTALYEYNVPVIDEGFVLYYGGGAHFGSIYDNGLIGSFGIDGIVGLEYKIPNFPMAFSFDFKPMFDIVERAKFRLDSFNLGIKLAF